MDINFNLTTADGRPASDLAKIIQLRSKEMGETTKQTCVALALNILRSLRVQTKIANETKADIYIRPADGDFFPSWKRDSGAKGRRVSRRILRAGPDGAEINPDGVIWRAPKYSKGEQLHSYVVSDKVAVDKTVKYIIVCGSEEEALKYAKEFHKAKVRRHKGLAKYAVGMAMAKVYAKQGLPQDGASSEAKSVARQNVSVSISETGFNSGSVNIHVHDALEYAADALKNGRQSVDTAAQNAVGKMIGFLKKKIRDRGGDLDGSLLVPVATLVNGGTV